MSGHTPLPWIARKAGEGGWTLEPDDGSYPGTFVLCWRAPWPNRKAESDANVELIVRACNAHEELLQAAKDALEYLEQVCPEDETLYFGSLRPAIAKAEGR